MNNTVKIWEYLANKFDNECLADEILSFSVEMKCNFDDFGNFSSYPFIISLSGLKVRLQCDGWETQFESCLLIKFICNLDLSNRFRINGKNKQ